MVENKNKIGFARWILSYKSLSEELKDFQEDFEKMEVEFSDREELSKKEKINLENLLNEKKEELSKSVEKVVNKNIEIENLKKEKETFEEKNNNNEVTISDLKLENTKLKKELKDLKKEFTKQSQVILDNTDSLNSRNKEIQELHKELSDKVLEIDELKKANEFLKNNRRAPTRDEILAYEKNSKAILRKAKVKS